jgi:hypothetical protein
MISLDTASCPPSGCLIRSSVNHTRLDDGTQKSEESLDKDGTLRWERRRQRSLKSLSSAPNPSRIDFSLSFIYSLICPFSVEGFRNPGKGFADTSPRPPFRDRSSSLEMGDDCSVDSPWCNHHFSTGDTNDPGCTGLPEAFRPRRNDGEIHLLHDRLGNVERSRRPPKKKIASMECHFELKGRDWDAAESLWSMRCS